MADRPVQLGVQIVASGESTQPSDAGAGDPWTPEGAIYPPVDLEALSSLTATARLRRSCIAAVVHNSVGLGYQMRVRDGHEEDIADIEADSREAITVLNALAARDKRLKRPSFTRQIRAVEWDKYECGNGYMEVSRNRTTGQIDGLFHVPGKRVRRRKDDSGWLVVQKEGAPITEAVSYYDFGDKVAYDESGQPQAKLADGQNKRWAINELIPFQLYTSESRDYGLPPDAQLVPDYLADKLASDTNITFFGSKGVPPTVVFVQGEEVEEGEIVKIEVPESYIRQIADTLTGSGTYQQKRVAVIGVPSGFKAQVENLAVTSERDLGYISFRDDVRRAVLGAYRLSPVFVSDIQDAGRYTAEVERGLTKEQVFDPEQQEVAEILNVSLIRELFPALVLKFDEMRIAGDEVQRQSANDLADRGRITNGEYREAHGFAPLPEAQKGQQPDPELGQVEFGWNRKLVEPGLGIHGGGVGAARGGLGEVSSRPPDSTQGQIAKGTEDELAAQVATEFDDAVAEALRILHESNPQLTPEPVVVEKSGDSILIAPYAPNGSR